MKLASRFASIRLHTLAVAESLSAKEFFFDNELPHHRVFVEPFSLSSRLVSNSEYLAFVDAGGYRDPSLWLSQG
jgi:formylglycine-generating enzyme required for sulfatase activity